MVSSPYLTSLHPPSSSGRCKFPLLNGRLDIDGGSLEPTITCNLCAVTHSLINGKAIAARSQGLLQNLSSQLFKSTATSNIKAYPAVEVNGAIYGNLKQPVEIPLQV